MPHDRLHNLGAITNSMAGMYASFPGPLVLPPSIPRNSLVVIGSFLYNYQMELLRILPYISRLSELLQREALITHPNQRHQVEWLSRQTGLALHELIYSTAPIAHLIRDLQIGDTPGSYRLHNRPNPDLAHLTNCQVGEAAQEIALEPQIKLPEAKEKELINKIKEIQKSISLFVNESHQHTINPDIIKRGKMFAVEISKKLGSVTNQKAWHLKLKEFAGINFSRTPKLEKFFLDVVNLLSVQDIFEMLEGKYSTIGSLIWRWTLEWHGGLYSPAGRKELCRVIANEIKANIAIPSEIAANVIPEFAPNIVIADAVEKHLNNIIHELSEYQMHKDSNKLSEHFHLFFKEMIGEILAELIEGFSNGITDINIFLKKNICNLLGKVGCEELGVVLTHTLSDEIQSFILAMFALFKEEKSKKGQVPNIVVPEEKKQVEVPEIKLAQNPQPKAEKKEEKIPECKVISIRFR